MSEQKIEARINPEQFTTIEVGYAKSYQQCLLCDNTREVPNGYGNRYPWVCDECIEAMAFLKELKYKQDNFDPLKPILD